jgi:hypothetical protein
LSEAGPGHFEETNPAVIASPGNWRAQIEPQASGRAVLIGETPGSNLTFAFSGRQVHLTVWVGPQGGRLLATLDGENIAGLPVDEKGRSYVDLFAAQERQESLSIVQDTSARRHTLRLTIGESASPDSGGKQCVIDAFQVSQKSTKPFPTVPVIGLAIACVVVGGLLSRTIRRETVSD